jgi:hypothetical protein
MARKGRKLPRKAYIQSAKIEILSGDTARMHTAVAMLDSLVMHYGPDPEAYYWMTKILVDFSEKRAGLDAKTETIKTMRAYVHRFAGVGLRQR